MAILFDVADVREDVVDHLQNISTLTLRAAGRGDKAPLLNRSDSEVSYGASDGSGTGAGPATEI